MGGSGGAVRQVAEGHTKRDGKRTPSAKKNERRGDLVSKIAMRGKKSVLDSASEIVEGLFALKQLKIRRCHCRLCIKSRGCAATFTAVFG